MDLIQTAERNLWRVLSKRIEKGEVLTRGRQKASTVFHIRNSSDSDWDGSSIFERHL